jgi:hypothetical protein
MSFRAHSHHVRNSELPIWRRLISLRSCFVCFSEATRTRFTANLERYDALYGFNRYHPRTDPPTERQLLATLEALEKERAALIAQWHLEAEQRRAAKLVRKADQRRAAALVQRKRDTLSL